MLISKKLKELDSYAPTNSCRFLADPPGMGLLTWTPCYARAGNYHDCRDPWVRMR